MTLTGNGTEGYFLAGSAGGVAQFGDAVLHGDRKNRPLQRADHLDHHHHDRRRLLAARRRRRHLLLRQREVLRLDRRDAAQPAGGRHGERCAASNGYWLVAVRRRDLLVRRAPASTARPAGMHLNQPIVGMAATRVGQGLLARRPRRRDLHVRRRASSSARPAGSTSRSRSSAWRRRRRAAATGSSPATAASSRSATRATSDRGPARGSAPSRAWPSTPDGAGYWMSNTVGQVFKFGDAPYFGDLFPPWHRDRARASRRRRRACRTKQRTARDRSARAPAR